MFNNEDTELKQVKVWKHHCVKCGRVIRGNGTRQEPFICCGVWKYNYKTHRYELDKVH